MLLQSYFMCQGAYNFFGISPSNSKINFLGMIPGSVKLVSIKKHTVVIKKNAFKAGITELLLI